ncbi:hypothetical protein [Rufibacter psychrotolerans]|uniref:hypothetical protein n=1 Tax=Rufibacter psychrotolerans TaxID=2812556 RepID=UPI0019672BAC|nr:hypothetical protein [Rufibacter sp. SYSU D00308]
MSDNERKYSLLGCKATWLVLLFLLAPALSTVGSRPGAVQPDDASWIFHSEAQGVKIYYKIGTCENRSVVFLKFSNTTKKKVELAWKEAYQTSQVPEELESYGQGKRLVLPPGDTSEDDCTQVGIKECITYSEKALPTFKADITRVNFKNVRVKPLE